MHRCNWCDTKPGIAEMTLRASLNAVSNCVFCAGWIVSTATSRIMSCLGCTFLLKPLVPMHHWQPGHRRWHVGYGGTAQAADIERAQIRAAEGDACGPWRQCTAAAHHHFRRHRASKEVLVEYPHLGRIGIFEQN